MSSFLHTRYTLAYFQSDKILSELRDFADRMVKMGAISFLHS